MSALDHSSLLCARLGSLARREAADEGTHDPVVEPAPVPMDPRGSRVARYPAPNVTLLLRG